MRKYKEIMYLFSYIFSEPANLLATFSAILLFNFHITQLLEIKAERRRGRDWLLTGKWMDCVNV
jgi:hypothetical protein